jgi:hypothetical protein
VICVAREKTAKISSISKMIYFVISRNAALLALIVPIQDATKQTVPRRNFAIMLARVGVARKVDYDYSTPEGEGIFSGFYDVCEMRRVWEGPS